MQMVVGEITVLGSHVLVLLSLQADFGPGSSFGPLVVRTGTRTQTNTNPDGTEASAAGRSGNACALRKQSMCGMIQEGRGNGQIPREICIKTRYLWVLRIPQNNKEEGARAKKLVTCGKRGPLGRGRSVPFSAQGAYCSAPEP